MQNNELSKLKKTTSAYSSRLFNGILAFIILFTGGIIIFFTINSFIIKCFSYILMLGGIYYFISSLITSIPYMRCERFGTESTGLLIKLYTVRHKHRNHDTSNQSDYESRYAVVVINEKSYEIRIDSISQYKMLYKYLNSNIPVKTLGRIVVFDFHKIYNQEN